MEAFKSSRAELMKILETLEFKSTNQNKGLEQSILFLVKNKMKKSEWIPIMDLTNQKIMKLIHIQRLWLTFPGYLKNGGDGFVHIREGTLLLKRFIGAILKPVFFSDLVGIKVWRLIYRRKR